MSDQASIRQEQKQNFQELTNSHDSQGRCRQKTRFSEPTRTEAVAVVPACRRVSDSSLYGQIGNRNDRDASRRGQQSATISSVDEHPGDRHSNVAETPMGRIVALLAVIGLVFTLTGCGDDGASPPATVGTPSVKPLPPEFRVLAEQLVLEMKPSPDDFRDDKGLPEIIAEGHSAILALRGIRSDDSDIPYVANQGQAAIGEAVSRLERINAMPRPPGAGSLLVESFIHGLYGNVYYGYALGVDADEKQKAIMAEVQVLLAAMDKADAAQMILPRIAEKYAATPTAPSGRIVVDLDESWGWFGPNDWLSIYNAGPEDLEDCTIQVHLTGGTGQSRKNVHFIRHWPANSWMYARYEPGEEILDRPEAGKSTVTKIQKADVSIWSPKYTTTLTYEYQGAEKDKDIAKWCKDVKFTGRYKPFVPGTLWDDQRGAEFTLDGVAIIPKCHVDVTFRKGAQSKAWLWKYDSWTNGEKKSFNTSAGDLTFDPSHIDMAISFPDTNYTHKVTLMVNK